MKKPWDMKMMDFDPEGDIAQQMSWDKQHGITADIYIGITKTKNPKCDRCWRHIAMVGTYEWENTCKRCNDVLNDLWDENCLTQDRKGNLVRVEP